MNCIGKSYNPNATPKGGYFFSLWGFMLLMAMVLALIILPVLMLRMDVARATYIGLLVQGFILFALPAWLVETYYRRSHLEEVWRLDTRDFVPKNLIPMFLLSVCTIISGSILVTQVEKLPVPAIFQELEQLTTEQYEMLVLEKDPLNRIFIWLGTVVAAPFGEELFFRGALLGWMLTKVKNEHAAIWIVALIFSAVHMQWSGLPTRLLIGGMLGYVAIYGGLWMAMLFHLLNNLLALGFPEQEASQGSWLWILITLPAMILLLKQMKRVATQNGLTTENNKIV